MEVPKEQQELKEQQEHKEQLEHKEQQAHKELQVGEMRQELEEQPGQKGLKEKTEEEIQQ